MEKITLKNGKWEATVVPAYGMTTTALTYDGEAILRAPASDEAFEKRPTVYGVPLLLPPSRTEGGKFTFDGVEYNLPINEPARGNHLHGFLNRTPFTITEQTESAVCAYLDNKGEIFPFPFRAGVKFTLDESGYKQEFTIENTGDKDMPLLFGLHSNFAEKDSFVVPIAKRLALNERLLPTGETLELSEQEKTFRVGGNSHGVPMEGAFTSDGCVAKTGKMRYTVSENFTRWVLWNEDGLGGFYSLEPLSGTINALNTGDGLIRLGVGESTTFTTHIGPDK